MSTEVEVSYSLYLLYNLLYCTSDTVLDTDNLNFLLNFTVTYLLQSFTNSRVLNHRSLMQISAENDRNV